MNNIDDMPTKCSGCPYWELADEHYDCNQCAELEDDEFAFGS